MGVGGAPGSPSPSPFPSPPPHPWRPRGGVANCVVPAAHSLPQRAVEGLRCGPDCGRSTAQPTSCGGQLSATRCGSPCAMWGGGAGRCCDGPSQGKSRRRPGVTEHCCLLVVLVVTWCGEGRGPAPETLGPGTQRPERRPFGLRSSGSGHPQLPLGGAGGHSMRGGEGPRIKPGHWPACR